MLNVSGHLISTAQVESALVSHFMVVEAAVVPVPHDIKGQCCHCFITLADPYTFNDQLKMELVNNVKTKIGSFASPDFMQV